MKYILPQIIFIAFLSTSVFSSDISVIQAVKTSQVGIILADNKLDLNSFKINMFERILTQPVILTSENLGELDKISFNVIPPDNYDSSFTIDVSINSGLVWKTLQKSMYFEFYPENDKTYMISIRVLTDDNAEIRTFKEYPITYMKYPEKHYSDLIKYIITIAFNNKEPASYLKYVSSSYTDTANNRYEEIEDKLNLEFEKYNNIKYTLKNIEISRLDQAKFRVIFDWTKSFGNKDNNNVENVFGRSIYIFENNLIIQTSGDSIFTDASAIKQISANPGILKGGSTNLIPGGAFEFAAELFNKDDILSGDIGIKKEGKLLIFYVPGGVIQDMGIIQISGISEAPDTGYSETAPVVIGHSYCLRNNNNRFAKLQVTYVEGTEIGQTSILVSINWIYQESESKILKPQ